MAADRVAPERLTPLDVSNLRVEKHGLPMNVAALAILEGHVLLDASGELALEAITARIEQRLHLAPRLRQRLYRPGFGFGAPVWVDDASFDISAGTSERGPFLPVAARKTLLATCVELNGRPFDQTHPPWEIWLLTGASRGHVWMLIRFHHVLADGTAALLLLGTLFDSAPDAPESARPSWSARPIPTRSELLGDALRISITGIRRGLRKVGSLGGPSPARTLLRQALQLAREGLAPRTSFNRPVGRQRHVLLVRVDLEEAKQVAHAHHATVNDLVLCAIAGGARALLTARGELRRPLVLKVSVAASVRTQASTSQAGNLVGVLATEVPPAGLIPARPHRATPYLYSGADITALIAAAGSLRFPLRTATYRTLIGLLAVTGMRVGEAIRLDDSDLDLTAGSSPSAIPSSARHGCCRCPPRPAARH